MDFALSTPLQCRSLNPLGAKSNARAAIQSAMRNILVIGGTGFIGGHLIERLCSDGFQVSALVRRTSNGTFLETLHGVKMREGDITDARALGDSLAGIDTVFCLATTRPTGAQDYDREVGAVHTVGTENLLRACESNGVGRLVYFSSVAAIGSKPGVGVYNETSEPAPTDAYGRAKLAAEKILHAHQSQRLGITVLRPASVFGERGVGPLRKIISFAGKGVVPVLGSGNNKQSFTYVGNTVDETMFLAARTDTIGKTYILSDNTPYTVNELVAAVTRALSRQPLILHVPLGLLKVVGGCANACSRLVLKRNLVNTDNLSGISSDRVFDPSRLFEELGYSQPYDLATAAQRTVEWHLQTSRAG